MISNRHNHWIIHVAIAIFYPSLVMAPFANAAESPRVNISQLTQIKIKLSSLSSERVEQISVPLGENLALRIGNRAFSAPYRFKIENAGFLGNWRDMRPVAPLRGDLISGDGPDCKRLNKKVADLYAAANESEIPGLFEQINKEIESKRCPSLMATSPAAPSLIAPSSKAPSLNPQSRNEGLQIFLQNLLIKDLQAGALGSEVVATMTLTGASERVKVTIERLDPSTKDPVKSWVVEIIGKPDSPKWRHRSESEWLTSAIATDIAEMAALAFGRSAPNVQVKTENLNTFDIVVRPWRTAEVVTKISFAGRYALSPDAFTPLASALLASKPKKTETASADVKLLTSLLEPTPETIVREDLNASTALGSDMFSPNAHEQAALVISALALRESGDNFSDLRPILSRLCAHLALARALRADGTSRSLNGLWAEASLLALLGRETESMSIIGNAKSGSAGERWARALTLRNTGDWRQLEDVGHASLLELREAFRASLERVGYAKALKLFEERKPSKVADWTRLALSYDYPVLIANTIAPGAVAEEKEEAFRVYRTYAGSELTSTRWLSELDGNRSQDVRTIDGKQSFSVLGWARWAPFLRRNLLRALHQEVYSLARMIGDYPGARELVRQQEAEFSKLKDYWKVISLRPSIQSENEIKSSPQGSALPKAECAGATAAIRERPESVMFVDWKRAENACSKERIRGSIPGVEFWFQPALLEGTLLEHASRFESKLSPNISTSTLEEMHKLAPWDSVSTLLLITRLFGSNNSPREAASMLKPVLDYDKRASYVLLRAATNSGADSGPYQEQVCEIDPEDCIGAGEYFAARGENSRAIKAFERALSKVGDSVLVANNMDWPVDYYLDNGREDDAFRIAKFAADVYSYRGLRTMGRLMERLGRYDDAVSWYQRIQERYDDSSVLEQLYVRYRQRVGGDRFAKESATALNKMFPNGLEKAAYSDFTNSPTSGDGCKITEKDMTQKLRETGLRTGDLIVAADGYRVHNAEQWTTIRSFSDDPAISLIVWRGGGYLQLNGKYIRMKYGPPGKGHLPELL